MADGDTSVVKHEANKPHRWQPGESGNPNGRPKREWTWASLLEDAAEEVMKARDGQEVSAKKAIAKRLLMMALEGDRQAIKDIMDRTDGYPMSSTDITSKGEKVTPMVNIDSHAK
jgi:hypothetical protein